MMTIDLISKICEILALIIGTLIAGIGLYSWKKEYKWKNRFEILSKIMLTAYELDNYLSVEYEFAKANINSQKLESSNDLIKLRNEVIRIRKGLNINYNDNLFINELRKNILLLKLLGKSDYSLLSHRLLMIFESIIFNLNSLSKEFENFLPPSLTPNEYNKLIEDWDLIESQKWIDFGIEYYKNELQETLSQLESRLMTRL